MDLREALIWCRAHTDEPLRVLHCSSQPAVIRWHVNPSMGDGCFEGSTTENDPTDYWQRVSGWWTYLCYEGTRFEIIPAFVFEEVPITMTRAQYTSELHHVYYRQFLTYEIIAAVKRKYNIERLQNVFRDGEPDWGTIRTGDWARFEDVIKRTVPALKLKEAGEKALNTAKCVCIAKAAARYLIGVGTEVDAVLPEPVLPEPEPVEAPSAITPGGITRVSAQEVDGPSMPTIERGFDQWVWTNPNVNAEVQSEGGLVTMALNQAVALTNNNLQSVVFQGRVPDLSRLVTESPTTATMRQHEEIQRETRQQLEQQQSLMEAGRITTEAHEAGRIAHETALRQRAEQARYREVQERFGRAIRRVRSGHRTREEASWDTLPDTIPCPLGEPTDS